MVQTVVIEKRDDFDHTQLADETILFSWRGENLEIDLTAAHTAEFQALMAPYLAVSRKAKRRYTKKPDTTAGAKKRVRNRAGEKPANAQREKIRDWANTPPEDGGGGLIQSRVGRVKQSVIDAYFAANPTEEKVV